MTSVLIVDDDEDIRAAVRFMLEDASYAVLEAGDGVTALAIPRTSARGMVVLLDNLMPHLDGETVLAEVESASGPLAAHAFVLVTASPQRITPALQARLTQFGVPVIAKPFAITTLLDAVRRAARRLPDADACPASRD